MSKDRVVIVGGGPTGLSLALLLARRDVPCVLLDARSAAQSREDQRLLALSRGSLQILSSIVDLAGAHAAPIREVIISSVGQFGRAVIGGPSEENLGLTMRYGELMRVLGEAAARYDCIDVRRPIKVVGTAQSVDAATAMLEIGESIAAPLIVSAEGMPIDSSASPTQAALVADVEVDGLASGTALERFTREGPLALLPRPVLGNHNVVCAMALVWCMSLREADRRSALSDTEFTGELNAAIGVRTLCVTRIMARGRYPLIEHLRSKVNEERIVYVGNAAQSLHPVAGQGFNLALRDCMELATTLGATWASDDDSRAALSAYAAARRQDRNVIGAITRHAPNFFSSRLIPLAAARSLGLTMLSALPQARRLFAHLLMFGVRR